MHRNGYSPRSTYAWCPPLRQHTKKQRGLQTFHCGPAWKSSESADMTRRLSRPPSSRGHCLCPQEPALALTRRMRTDNGGATTMVIAPSMRAHAPRGGCVRLGHGYIRASHRIRAGGTADATGERHLVSTIQTGHDYGERTGIKVPILRSPLSWVSRVIRRAMTAFGVRAGQCWTTCCASL